LTGVDENRGGDNIGVPKCLGDQGKMTKVQRPHGGNQSIFAPLGMPSPGLGPQFRRGPEDSNF
jgi:hypothetical protein